MARNSTNRCRTPSGVAGMSTQDIAHDSVLAPWPIHTRRDQDVIRLLEERMGQASNYIREDIDIAVS